MKKMVLIAAVAFTFVASAASFASSANCLKDFVQGVTDTIVCMTGHGACRHAGCRCTWYNSAGNGGKCVCGHWDYVHN